MTSDRNYVFQTAVTIYSILENSSESNYYDINILVSSKDIGIFDKILNDYKTSFCNFEYHYLVVNLGLYSNVKLSTITSLASYYRLQLAELLPYYDECLFLDGDLIVNLDVGVLFEHNLNDNLIGGVLDWGMQCYKDDYYVTHADKIGINDLASYVNAGVMLFNLKLFREEKLTGTLIREIDRHYPIDDQDILNVVCYNRISVLPSRFNVFNTIVTGNDLENANIFSREEILELRDYTKVAIIHFARHGAKPWENPNVKWGWIWIDYFKKAYDISSTILQLFNEALVFNSGYNRPYLYEKASTSDNIVLFGMTQNVLSVINTFPSSFRKKIKIICDNSELKWGHNIDGIYCQSPYDSIEILCNERTLIVVLAKRDNQRIIKQLIDLGCDAKQILCYKEKGDLYYKWLDERQYDDEKNHIYCEVNEKIHKSLTEFKETIDSLSSLGQYTDIFRPYRLEMWLKKKNDLVSIIVPAYNSENTIDKCLGSIFNQTYMNWECIIIDDGSTDNTFSSIDKWSKRDCRFKCIRQNNKGMGIARNIGISVAMGIYITFIDSDDWVGPDYISDMYCALEETEADICKSTYYTVDASRGDLKSKIKIDINIDAKDLDMYVSPNLWGNMFKRSLFVDNNIIMPNFAMEDFAIYPLLLLCARKIVVIDKSNYYYHINCGGSIMDTLSKNEDLPKAIEYMVRCAKDMGIYLPNELLLCNIAMSKLKGHLYGRIAPNTDEEEFSKYKLLFQDTARRVFGHLLVDNNIWIFGSYNLTRIVANIPTLDKYYLMKKISYYFGFSSILSLSNKTSPAIVPTITANSLRQNMLYKDLASSFYNIKPDLNDILIFDLIEEANDMFEINGRYEYTKSDIWSEVIASDLNIIKRTDISFETWKESANHFIEFIRSKFDSSKVFMIENYLATEVKHDDGRITRWYPVDKINILLNQYYKYLKQQLPNINIISNDIKESYTDSTARYGTSPKFHNNREHCRNASRLLEILAYYS